LREDLVKPPLIELNDVSIVRGSSRILQNVSLTIREGEHTAILGPNGCGKSTLIKALTREIYPYGGEGSVRICGLDRWVISELRSKIAVVAEEPRDGLLGSPTGLDLVLSGLFGTYGVTAHHKISSAMRDEAAHALERVDAGHLANREVKSLSTGERRRAWIARAMVCRPIALVLDEPTSGLDLKAAHEFSATVERLAQSGVTVILVTHHLEEIVPAIRRVILMRRGHILADGNRDELLRIETLAHLFEVQDPKLKKSIESKLEASVHQTAEAIHPDFSERFENYAHN
jgi:iron complex transport system ATP-binding protein